MFANPIATMFAVDLFISSFVFWVFLHGEGRRLVMGNLWVYVVLNLAVGLSLARRFSYISGRAGWRRVLPESLIRPYEDWMARFEEAL